MLMNMQRFGGALAVLLLALATPALAGPAVRCTSTYSVALHRYEGCE
jgi:hypothetical protein